MDELSSMAGNFMELDASEQLKYVKDDPFDALRIIWWFEGRCDGLREALARQSLSNKLAKE